MKTDDIPTTNDKVPTQHKNFSLNFPQKQLCGLFLIDLLDEDHEGAPLALFVLYLMLYYQIKTEISIDRLDEGTHFKFCEYHKK